ncbi:hypothetical protein PAHAL_5G218100 [Panicum hallii]|jgi:hypothetical protein|uniref:DUF1645 domain-containing protein n=1 Tax=Panicum hallii TaxID=206008 RepID=A0A2S3HT94_9POAL|nr:uncharacterized protein LOC112893917 [Panicum hallii]PAN29342.1 hypothetical protein PAHAL_5G218100 [Panicum hallii]
MEEDTGQGPGKNLSEPPLAAVEVEVEAEDEEDDGFSFPALPLAADACVVPVYPIFGRPPSPPPTGEAGEDEPETATLRVPLGRLLLEEREFRARQEDARSASARAWQEEDGEEASAAADEELEGVPPESYCLWAPGGGPALESAPASPRRCRKSGSTGSVLRWRRISERLVGRSHSDGKEKFVFLTAAAAAGPEPPPPPPPRHKEEEEGGGSTIKVRDGVGAANQLRYYGRGGGGGSGSRRRSYLPYKQELVGLFANISGLRRSYHPF